MQRSPAMNAVVTNFDTTLVRHGVQATTMSEMQTFANSITDRPLDKLLGDLPGLAKLSEMKFILARQVLRRRVRELPEVEREQLRLFAEEVASKADDWAAERIRRIFERA